MIVPERTRAILASQTRFTQLYEWSSIDSTNRWLLDAAGRGATEGTVALADHQTAGRGRLQRRWEAPAGTGLLMSVLLVAPDLPVARRHLLSAAMGLAARAACAEVGGFQAELKWPNDLEVGGAKLAGVLAQARGPAVVVGIGCNVSWSPPGATHAEAWAGRLLDRGQLAAALLVDLERRLGHWDQVAQAYRTGCATVGRRVTVQGVGERVTGSAEGVDDYGRLLLRRDSGQLQTVAVGDVVHLRSGPDW